MAMILEGSDHSPVIWGKIGNYLIYRTISGKIFLRVFTKPIDTKTIPQIQQREAYKEGIVRWNIFEKQDNSEYWFMIRNEHNFNTNFQAYISSLLLTYKQKMIELGHHNLAIAYVQNISNPITYMESYIRKQKQLNSINKISAIFKYRKSEEFQNMLSSSIIYLETKGWLNRTAYGMIPYIDSTNEESLRIRKLVPAIGGFGTGNFGKKTFGTKR